MDMLTIPVGMSLNPIYNEKLDFYRMPFSGLVFLQ